MNRRKFTSTALTGSLAAALPVSSLSGNIPFPGSDATNPKYKVLDDILKKPVFRKEYFSAPVIIDTLELLRYKNSFICRVRSKDGAEGISIGHSGQLKSLYPVF